MKLKDKIAVVTGGAGGIGKAMAHRFIQEGARQVIIADLDEEKTLAAAREIGAAGIKADVRVETDIINLVEESEANFGPIDLFCSNAGICILGGIEVSDEDWQKIWDINLMAHVYAARTLIPKMLARGGGYLLNTASAAGLLSQIGSAPYSVTKHAAVAFAEFLSITHGKQGIKVSVLCPQAVRTEMTAGMKDGGVAGVDGMLEPHQLAETVIETLEEERFLVLPHPEVLTYMQRKTSDYDRWLGGMQRLQERFSEQ
ncbi:MAG: SDR family oxidoreductase [SAR324 cluster bacterium]|nr:SDR family oxidoreductase [SAR324 cluster bacterium]